ncbi:hypothetical protein HY620_00125 [Candidatus Uhrbacteria bacterium]|nr:hypothetical protein [Candidatus Uhrbacteria bacterium]
MGLTGGGEFGERAERRYTTSGLYEDALNAYSWLGSLFIDGPKIRELLRTKIRTYDEYLRDTYHDQAGGILAQSNHETIRQLDALVEEYNELATKGEVTNEIAKKYCDKIVALFREGKGVMKRALEKEDQT